MLIFVVLNSSCNLTLSNLMIKSDKQKLDIEFEVMGVPFVENKSPKDRYIMNLVEYINWFTKICDSLKVNNTLTIAKDSTSAKVFLSIDEFETANSLMQSIKKKGCTDIECQFYQKQNNYSIMVNTNRYTFPNYKYDLDRGKIILENRNSNIDFFPLSSTTCLKVHRPANNRIEYTILGCEKNPASPLQKIIMSYTTKIDSTNVTSKSIFTEKNIIYICTILGGIASLITIIGYFRTRS